jgi:alpha-mannosidase
MNLKLNRRNESFPYLIQSLLILFFLIYPFTDSQSQEKTKPIDVKVVGHAHMDPVYRWRWNEMENREIFKTFSDVLNELDTFPDLHFAQSYMLYYETIQNRFPELYKKVRQSISEKRWSVVGGQWVETDETLPSGESLIRQFLVGRDYYTKNLGINNVTIAWLPDVFTGHSSTIPKIYAGCGIKNYVFSREAPEDKRIFWWESADGSRILAYKIPGHYNPDYKILPGQLEEWVKISGYKTPLITVGKGDHGGGPGKSDIRSLKMLSGEFPLQFEFTSPEDYFNQLNHAKNNWPVQNEEFGYQPNGGQWLGCYTSQAKIKKLNRHLENQLIAAEKFSAIGTIHKGKPFYPREDFLKAWKILLFNQFHDIIPGTLTGLGANDVFKDYDKLEQISSELLNAGIENIGNRINTEMDGIPLVVYNPHSWTVSQFVDIEVSFVERPAEFSIKDSKGNDIAYSIIKKSEDKQTVTVSINAQDVPALGYKVFAVVNEKPEIHNTALKVAKNQIENEFFILKWNDEGVTSIFNKKLQKEFISGVVNTLQLLEDNGNSWSLKLTGKEFPVNQLAPAKVIFSSPEKVTVQWEDYFQSSKFVRFMTVYANSEQIDFEMEVDWHSHNKLLRLAFPTTLTDGQAYYDQSYGYVLRKETNGEFPAQKWIDYSGKNYGVSLINNGKYGFTINSGILTMSVVRGARDMDPRMDEGKHSFKYALNVHKGDWRDANIPLRAWEFNQPLIAKQENQHPGEILGWTYSNLSFPMEKSFFGINSDHVIISSLKTKQDAYDPNPVILRIIETEGRDENVTVQLPYEAKSVIECNHLEEPIKARSEIKTDETRFHFTIGHDQIRTFMIYF